MARRTKAQIAADNAKFDRGMEYGVKAFYKGIKSAPALDREFLENCIAGLEIGEGLPYYDGWARGWHTENLKVPY